MIQSLNPATGVLLRSFDALTAEAVGAKLALAADAAKSYPRNSLEQRVFWMRRLASLLDADIEELASLMTAEMGKTLAAARQEVLKCAAVCRYYADNAAHILAPEPIPTEYADSYVRYDPLGVVLAVMPWNFPLWQVFRFAAPALMAGNVGLLKHASNVPQCALAIEALIRRAGFPRGTFQTLLLEPRQVETLLADDRVAAVTVTGSEAAGRAIAAQAGWLIKKSVLELGGSDPFLVMSSADLDLAVPNAVKARCINNGQSCIAAKRFIVSDAVYEEFERRFTEAMGALRVGNPTDPSTEIGPIATAALLDELLTQVSIARADGGKILTGGGRARGDGLAAGNYFQPTVVANVSRLSPICKAEIFGPVALLFRVGSLDEAIALANDTPFGLAASAWTSDPVEQHRLATELQCGAVFFNQTVTSDPRLPFGGIKRSGYGRELSAAGMREFLNAKTVVVGQMGAGGHAAVNASTGVHLSAKVETRASTPTEFSTFAEQIRKWEPRKPPAEAPILEEPVLQTRRSAGEGRESRVPPKAEPEAARSLPELVLRPAQFKAESVPVALKARVAQLAPEREPDKTKPERRPPNGLRPIVFDTVPDPIRMAPLVWEDTPEDRKLAPIVWESKPDERKLAPIVWDKEPEEFRLPPVTRQPASVQPAPEIPEAEQADARGDSAIPARPKMPRLIYGDEASGDEATEVVPDDKRATRGSILGL